MAITFYYGSGSPFAWRVWLALEHKKLGYDFKLMSFSDGDLKKPEFRALNPRGMVPLIVDGDFVLGESNAIVEYLDEQYPATPQLFPGTTRERAQVRRWISDIDDSTSSAVDKLTNAVLFTKPEHRDEEKIAAARAGVIAELEFIAAQGFAGGDYVAGRLLSAADFALYPAVAMLARCDLRKPDLKMVASRPAAIAAWAKRIEGLPYFAKTLPPHWKS
jgi:glutathione S-transferase